MRRIRCQLWPPSLEIVIRREALDDVEDEDGEVLIRHETVYLWATRAIRGHGEGRLRLCRYDGRMGYKLYFIGFRINFGRSYRDVFEKPKMA